MKNIDNQEAQQKEEPTQPGELNIVYVYELYLNFIEKLGYNKTSVTIEQLASIKSSFHNLLNEMNIQKK